jgi:hypothetical protein
VLGDVLLRAAVEEHGAEGLVAAVIRMRGPGKELAERGVVHHRYSLGLSVASRRRAEGQNTRGRRSIEGDRGEIEWEIVLVITTSSALGTTEDGTEGEEPADNDRGDPLQISVQADQNVSRFPFAEIGVQ